MTMEQGSSYQTAKIGSAQWWELVESIWDFNSLNHTFISCSQISSEGFQILKLSCPLQRPRKHIENNSRSKVNQKVPAGRNRLLLQKVSTNFTHWVSNRGLNRHVARENPSVRYQTLHHTHTLGLHHHTRSVSDKRKTGHFHLTSKHHLQKILSAIRNPASWMCV